ncbi:dirigent protein 22-like [Punica granatum]|uniref:Dirigent protein n=2 Tax=Punica granatum TaxID=22663 RepID=A0A2I0LCY0_PUNGR|nr:dirigent protein 22-like [Punica granatum]PKI78537.1 hypothetical protein CRG98_001095 [Punica granatum]
MAMSLAKLSLFAMLFFSSTLLIAKSDYAEILLPEELGLKTRKLTHLHFYLHENITGPFPNVIRVAQAETTDKSPFSFGAVNVVDDPILVGPDRSSKQIGRAQAVMAFASQNDFAVLMAINLAFTEGKYNGSTVTILGRNMVFTELRELPVVGGSGVFRFATGYVKTSTHFMDLKAGIVVLEYDVYVFHF